MERACILIISLVVNILPTKLIPGILLTPILRTGFNLNKDNNGDVFLC